MWFQNKMKIANGVMISKVYIHVGGCTHTNTHTHTHTHTTTMMATTTIKTRVSQSAYPVCTEHCQWNTCCTVDVSLSHMLQLDYSNWHFIITCQVSIVAGMTLTPTNQ